MKPCPFANSQELWIHAKEYIYRSLHYIVQLSQKKRHVKKSLDEVCFPVSCCWEGRLYCINGSKTRPVVFCAGEKGKILEGRFVQAEMLMTCTYAGFIHSGSTSGIGTGILLNRWVQWLRYCLTDTNFSSEVTLSLSFNDHMCDVTHCLPFWL